LLVPLWLWGYGTDVPLSVLVAVSIGSCLYLSAMAYGALRISGLSGLALFICSPVYALMEHVAPLYALATRERDFVVIEK